jgi:hypothetical protein
MATSQPFGLDLSVPEPHTLPIYRRLGLANGLLIGLALALGAWGDDLVRSLDLPFPLQVPTLLLGMAAVILVCALAGWLSARVARSWLTVLVWLAAGVACILLLGYLSTYGRTLVVWLADQRFWGRPVFPYLFGTRSGLLLGGFPIALVLLVLGLIQDMRLQHLASELRGKRGPGGRALFSLIWPVPIVFLAAFLTQNMMFDPAAVAAEATYDAIETVRDFEGDRGDLVALGQERGANYGALAGVRDRLTPDYTLGLGEVDAGSTSVFTVAHFDTGAWVTCRLVNDQLSHCYDASGPYTTGLASLITGQPVPEDCRGCEPIVSSEAEAWLAANRGRFGDAPQIERQAQYGGDVLMRVTGNGASAECWFTGILRVRLERCIDR